MQQTSPRWHNLRQDSGFNELCSILARGYLRCSSNRSMSLKTEQLSQAPLTVPRTEARDRTVTDWLTPDEKGEPA